MNDKCLKVILEIINSEKSYLTHLDKLQNFFSKPLLDRNFLHQDVHSSIFSQLDAISQINGKLLEDLEEENTNIGEVFLKFAPFFKVYSSYAKNFDQAIAILMQYQSDNEAFKSFIEATETRPEVQMKLTAFLIEPIQRIPRYKLLLEQLLKSLDVEHVTYADVKAALNEVSKAASYVDGSLADEQSARRLARLQKALRRGRPCVIAPGRKLLKEGILKKVCRGGTLCRKRAFFLFTDLLLCTRPGRLSSAFAATSDQRPEACGDKFCDPPLLDLRPNSLECCCVMPLRGATVTVVFGGADEGIAENRKQGAKCHGVTFRVQSRDKDLLLCSEGALEGRLWAAAVRAAAADATTRHRTLRRISMGSADISVGRRSPRIAFGKKVQDEISDKENRKRNKEIKRLGIFGNGTPKRQKESRSNAELHLVQSTAPCSPILKDAKSEVEISLTQNSSSDSESPIIRNNESSNSQLTTSILPISDLNSEQPYTNVASNFDQVIDQNVTIFENSLIPSIVVSVSDSLPTSSSVSIASSDSIGKSSKGLKTQLRRAASRLASPLRWSPRNRDESPLSKEDKKKLPLSERLQRLEEKTKVLMVRKRRSSCGEKKKRKSKGRRSRTLADNKIEKSCEIEKEKHVEAMVSDCWESEEEIAPNMSDGTDLSSVCDSGEVSTSTPSVCSTTTKELHCEGKSNICEEAKDENAVPLLTTPATPVTPPLSRHVYQLSYSSSPSFRVKPISPLATHSSGGCDVSFYYREGVRGRAGSQVTPLRPTKALEVKKKRPLTSFSTKLTEALSPGGTRATRRKKMKKN